MALRGVFLVMLAMAIGAPARADQCAWNSNKVAIAGAALIVEAGKTTAFCQPCGDAQPAGAVDNTSVEVRQVAKPTGKDPAYFEVVVNGKGVDLAYVYILNQAGFWVNVGLKVKCGATEVAPHWPIGGDPKVLPGDGND